MKICHVGTLPLERMGTITHTIFHHTVGEHVYEELGEELPPADIYLLECFKKRWEEFRDFKRPHANARIISLVHSSSPCCPATASDRVVCLSDWSASEVGFYGPALVIPGCLSWISTVQPRYDLRRFGRITRNAPGKFHPRWWVFASKILAEVPSSEFVLFTDTLEGLDLPNRTRTTTSIGMHATGLKIKALAQLSVAVFAHGDFRETFCVAMLECMAAGLPIVYLYQPALRELAGDGQICCSSIEQVATCTISLLKDEEQKQIIGSAARERAAQFTAERMIYDWNRLFTELAP